MRPPGVRNGETRQAVLEYVKSRTLTGRGCTYAEIAEAVGVVRSVAWGHVQNLIRSGDLADGGTPRHASRSREATVHWAGDIVPTVTVPLVDHPRGRVLATYGLPETFVRMP